jgi:hypothetical protein
MYICGVFFVLQFGSSSHQGGFDSSRLTFFSRYFFISSALKVKQAFGVTLLYQINYMF